METRTDHQTKCSNYGGAQQSRYGLQEDSSDDEVRYAQQEDCC